VDLGELAIFALAGVLAIVPALVDRWAVRRGASPEALIALATVTLAAIAALPVAFAICTGALAAQHASHGTPGVAAIVGLMLVAVAAGRTLARTIAIRRRWRALSRFADALQLPTVTRGVRVLPVGELLAFASGTEAFVSQGLLDRLSLAERRAVIEHEREHAQRAHGRLLAAARALTHGAFGLVPAQRASQVLDRELDVLADRAAAMRLGDPTAVESALRALAAQSTEDASAREQAATERRLERLATFPPGRGGLVDRAVRLVTLIIAAAVLTVICLSLHTSTLWAGAAACALLVASMLTFSRPLLGRDPPPAHTATSDVAAASRSADSSLAS
jgi:Zn-dependent protease with chaperone function